MTTTLRDMIAEKAKELLKVIKGYPYEGLTIRQTEDMVKLATHVIEKEIEARIQEITVLLLDPEMDMELDRIIRNRIKDLQDQLKQIRSTKQ